MKKIIIFLIPLFLVTSSFSQRIIKTIEFNNKNYFNISEIKADKENNFIISGSIYDSVANFDPLYGGKILAKKGNLDAFIAKYDSSGKLLWINHYGEKFVRCEGQSCAIDDSGNIYFSGTIDSTIDFDSSITSEILISGNSFIAKYTKNGDLTWARNISQGYYTSIQNMGEKIIFCNNQELKLFDKIGNIIWSKPQSNYDYKIIGINDSLFYLINTSWINIPTQFSKVKIDGSIIWSKKITNAWVNALEIDKNNNLCMVGGFIKTTNFQTSGGVYNLFASSAENHDAFFAKYDFNTGNMIFAKSIGGVGQENINDIIIDNDDNIYLTGDYMQSGDYDPGIGVKILPIKGLTSLFLAKYNNNGAYLWAYGTGNDTYGNKLAVLGAKKILLYGGLRNDNSSIDLDFSSNEKIINSSGMFLAFYDTIQIKKTQNGNNNFNDNLVKDIDTINGSEPQYLFTFNDEVYFVSNDGKHGYEIWKSDGTEDGTVLLKDINPLGDGVPSKMNSNKPINPQFTILNNKLYFIACNDTSNAELWVTDGTSIGTKKVIDLNGTSSSCGFWSSLCTNSSKLFFRAKVGQSYYIFASDGTSNGTVSLQSLTINSLEYFEYGNFIKPVNNKVFFCNFDSLLVTDGTVLGTHFLTRVYWPKSFTTFKDKLVFSTIDNLNLTGEEIWISDGTVSGTHIIKDIMPGADPSYPNNIYAMGDLVYFTAADELYRTWLWKTDGTETRTTKIKLLNDTGNPIFKAQYANNDKIVYFNSEDSVHNISLWRTDGTEKGTFMLLDINKNGTGFPGNLVVCNNKLIFGVDDGSGFKLYRTCKGDTSYKALRNIAELGSGYPDFLTYNNGSILFSANDPILGTELWKYVLVNSISINNHNDDCDINTSKEEHTYVCHKNNKKSLTGNHIFSYNCYPANATDSTVIATIQYGSEKAKIEGDQIIIDSTFNFDTDSIVILLTADDGSDSYSYLKISNSIPLGEKENIISDNFSIFPNPANSIVFIEGKTESTIELFNINGNCLFRSFMNESPFEINIDNFSSGIYILRLSNKNSIENKKLIIE